MAETTEALPYEIETVTDMRWRDAEKKRMSAKVTFKNFGETIIITQGDDWSPLSREVYRRAMTGEFGEILPFDVPAGEVPKLSTRQFFVGLTKKPWEQITQGEAMAYFRTGAIPAKLVQAIDLAIASGALPAGMTRFDIEAMIVAAQEYDMTNPLAMAIAAVMGWTEDELRQFWLFAAKL